MLNVCVPVLKRYDLLREMFFSLEKSTVAPDRVYIIDNGQDARRLKVVVDSVDLHTDIFTPDAPMGIAESWNWFIQHVDEERLIVNDDILFSPLSIAEMLSQGRGADLVWASDMRGTSIGFSCFLLRDSCVEKIGYFDESISPGYGYYEDDDYLQRLDGRGTREPSARAVVAQCRVLHVKSATLKKYTNEEMAEHHRKFKLAQANYAKKWNVVFDESNS